MEKLLTESNCQALGLNVISNEVSEGEKSQHEEEKEHIFHKYVDSDWYGDIVYFLLFLQSPLDLDKGKFISLKLKSTDYCIYEHDIFWKDHIGILLRGVDKEEAKAVTAEMHEGDCGGNRYWKATAFKIMRESY